MGWTPSADLGVFLIVALVGFGLGQVIGIFTDIDLLRVGPVHALEATIVAWIGSVLTKLVMGEQTEGRLKGERFMVTMTRHRYIVSNDKILSGEPIIEGTRTPVRAIVGELAHGATAGGDSTPPASSHIGPGFDALSYYSDHQPEIDEYIERNRVPYQLVDPLAL